jgi:hypothetical protein
MAWAEVRAAARRLLPGVRTAATCRGATRCCGANRAISYGANCLAEAGSGCFGPDVLADQAAEIDTRW